MEQSGLKGTTQYAMEYGTYFGLLLIIKFVLTSVSQISTLANMLTMALVIASPIFAFYLTKVFRNRSGIASFGRLWLFGIYMHFFAALLCGIFEYIYYVYISPDYLIAQQEALKFLVEELVKASPSQSMTELKEGFDRIGPMSAIQLVFNGIWGMLVLGTIYSLLLALILRIRKNQSRIY